MYIQGLLLYYAHRRVGRETEKEEEK